MRFKLIGLICLIMQCNLSCTQHIINKETVQTLDLHRYMGKWFEIARFDHRFEHNLVGATVEYSFLPNGDIEVVNSGYWGNFSGSFKRAKGIAKITDPTCPSKLKVCFFMRFYAEYNIMEIDEDNYSYALVGSNTSDYLWLLSRTPTLPEEAILFLLTLKSATKLFSVLLASKRPLITELADKLRLKYPLLPTISPCPTMRLEAIRSIIPISCRRYPKSV